MGFDSSREGEKIIQAMLDDVSHNPYINPLVAMHDNVAETGHLSHGAGAD